MSDTTPEKIREAAMERFNRIARAKYDKGQVEHGSLLTDTVRMDFIDEEIIDLWFYASAMRTKIEKLYEKTDSTCSNPECRGCNCG